jgi:hypothetical protein
MSFKIIKFNPILFLFVFFSLFYIAWPVIIRAAVSPDAIAVRIVDNPAHYSSLNWYQSQKFIGSPQIMQIDGYEAVRNGRTVYINVANITDKNNDGILDSFDNNIFIISYNQDAQGVTSDIFGQLLKNFKFNTNLTDLGNCNKTNTITCLGDNECPVGEYCSSKKAKVVRDVKRLSGLTEMKLRLDAYKQKNNNYPSLKGGTYLPNKTLSTWPSWQQTLGKALGVNLPIDPINKLGDCPNFDSATCWNEKSQTFATDLSQLILPAGSHVFLYSTNDQGNFVKYCTQMESNYPNIQAFNCFNDKKVNSQPQITAVNLTGHPKKEFTGYAAISDADGDPLKLSIDLVNPDSGTWTSRRWQWDSGFNKFAITSLPEAGQKKIHAAKAGNSANLDYYKVKLTLDDGQGEANSIFSKIYDVNITPLPASLDVTQKTIVIGTQDKLTMPGTDSNQDPFTNLAFKSANLDGTSLTEAELNSHGFVLNDINLVENFQPAQRTGVYTVNVYGLDPIAPDTKIDSYFTYTITNNPPTFQNLTATFSNNTKQICNATDKCLIAIDNSEAAKIEIKGTDPDGHNVNYSLVDNLGGKLTINPVSGVITGLEKLNYQQLTDQTFNISVKIADSYCNNSKATECSSIYSFDLLVEKFCSINVPESTLKVDLPGPFAVNQSGQNLETGLTLSDCSAVGTSTADIELIGESHSQAIVLVSDLSASMETNVTSNGTTETAISRLKKALVTTNTGFFDRVYELAKKLSADYFTKISLVAYNGSVRSYLDLTNIASIGSLKILKDTVNLYSTDYETNTLLGLNKAEETLNKIVTPGVEKIVILMSDGIPGIDGYEMPQAYCYTPEPPSCSCGGTYPDCTPYPTCGPNAYISSCTTCTPYTCNCGGTYPNCTPYVDCPPGQYNDSCTSCYTPTPPPHSAYNNFNNFKSFIANLFKVKSVQAITTPDRCIYDSTSCERRFPNYCKAGDYQYCSVVRTIPCDITLDVNTEAAALKKLGISLYTIYYNTSDTLEPKQKMCNWSSNNGLNCDNNTFAFAGTDIDTMISKVLGRIVTKPKDVTVALSSITDSDPSAITSSVTGANITGLLCGAVKPPVTYTNNGYLKFSNIKLNYCGAKLHP